MDKKEQIHSQNTEKLVQFIRNNIIGQDRVLQTPFGERRITYADYTASGRSLKFIEAFIQNQVLPLYANTHTEASGTGLQTSLLREEAREIIGKAVGATKDDVVIFSGSGATGAINTLIDCLNIRLPSDLNRNFKLQEMIPVNERPVIFIGPYEHHSNELPWRETIAEVLAIPEDESGAIDLIELERQLKRFESRKVKIGSFSAASNVTGVLTDTYSISCLLHRYGALAFFDFAAAAPYIKMDMHPKPEKESDDPGLDAIFISPHKFIGGPQTPGVLVAKKSLFLNRVPAKPGGGTVSFVSPFKHAYLGEISHREEGGTPAIIESIRAGLIFQLKEKVGVKEIEQREKNFISRAIEQWSKNPAISILGSKTLPRLSIISFNVGQEKPLHHNFAVRLLNDLFGIQARGGCSCAGPYGHHLLGIGEEKSQAFYCVVTDHNEGIKPGWIRVNFNYFISEDGFQFILDAVDFISKYGICFLPLYSFNITTGLWEHHDPRIALPFSIIRDLDYYQGRLQYRCSMSTGLESEREKYLEEAKHLAERVWAERDRYSGNIKPLPEELEKLRWFVLPQDIL